MNPLNSKINPDKNVDNIEKDYDDQVDDDIVFEISQSNNANDKGTQTDFSYMGTIQSYKSRIIKLNRERAK